MNYEKSKSNLIEKELYRSKKALSYLKRNMSREDDSILVLTSKGDYYSQISNNGRICRRYIRKKDKAEVESLLRKGLRKETRRILEKNIALLEKIADDYRPYDMESVLDGMSNAYKAGFGAVGRKLRRDALFFPEAGQLSDEEFDSCLQVKYDLFNAKNYFPEALSLFTAKGEARRSRIEVIISNIYDSMGVIYQYEPTLRWDWLASTEKADSMKLQFGIPDIVIPDFVFPMGSEPDCYHEHLGLRELQDYNENWSKKELFYFLNDIRLGDRLIVTCDTADGNVNSEEIYDIAERIKWKQDRSLLI